MKKYLSIFASVALVALCMSSCKEKNKPTPEPEPEPVVVPSIAVTIDEVSFTEIDFTVNPSDTTLTFVSTWYSPAGVEGKTNEQLQAMIKDEIDAYIENLISTGDEATYADFLRNGKKSLYFSEMDPGTEYVIVVTYMDAEGNCSGTVGKANATTKAVVEPTGEIVNVDGVECVYLDDYRDYDGSFIAYFGNEDESFEMALCLFDEDFAGTFGLDDLDEEYSYLWTAEEGDLGFQGLDVEATLSSDNKKSTFAVAAIGMNGVQYNFSADVDLEYWEVAGAPARRLPSKKGVKSIKKLARVR